MRFHGHSPAHPRLESLYCVQGDDASAHDEGHAVGQPPRFFQIMGGQENGYPFSAQPLDEGPQAPRANHVQAHRWFV